MIRDDLIREKIAYQEETKREILNQNETGKPKQRDNWEKAQIVGQLLLPLVIALVGISFTYYQYKNAEAKQRSDREIEQEREKTEKVSNLLKHLASKEEKESLLAIQVIKYLGEKKQVPEELTAALFGVVEGEGKTPKVAAASSDTLATFANKSDDPKLKQEVRETFEKAVSNEQNSQVALAYTKSLAKVNEQAVVNMSARVYLHILKGTPSESAEQLQKQLKENGLNVLGIEAIDNAPNQNELRYFFGSSQDDVNKISRVMNSLEIKTNMVDLSDRHQNFKIRPRHYEIWLGKLGKKN